MHRTARRAYPLGRSQAVLCTPRTRVRNVLLSASPKNSPEPSTAPLSVTLGNFCNCPKHIPEEEGNGERRKQQ